MGYYGDPLPPRSLVYPLHCYTVSFSFKKKVVLKLIHDVPDGHVS